MRGGMRCKVTRKPFPLRMKMPCPFIFDGTSINERPSTSTFARSTIGQRR